MVIPGSPTQLNWDVCRRASQARVGGGTLEVLLSKRKERSDRVVRVARGEFKVRWEGLGLLFPERRKSRGKVRENCNQGEIFRNIRGGSLVLTRKKKIQFTP